MDAFKALTAGVSFKRKRQQNVENEKPRSETPSSVKAKVQADPKPKPKPKNKRKRRDKEKKKDSYPLESESGGSDSDDLMIMSGMSSKKKLRSAAAKSKEKADKDKDRRHWEEMQAIRHANRIRVEGNSVPDPVTLLSDIKLKYSCPQFLIDNLARYNYVNPTPIQMQAISVLLEDRELLACAPTGSGKTLAFLLPLICHCLSTTSSSSSTSCVRTVVLSPTRELANQTYQELVRLTDTETEGEYNLNVVYLKQRVAKTALALEAIENGVCDILVATPMRLVKLIKRNSDLFSDVERLVLDEADKLFEMEFLGQVDKVLSATKNAKRIISLFSATMLPQVEDLARTVLRDPIRVIIGHRNVAAGEVKQRLMFVGREEGKRGAIRQLLRGRDALLPPILIFVQAKTRAEELYKELLYDQVNVGVIHSDRTQAEREETVQNFRIGKIWVLIATDIFARGMDFKGVNCVVNYDFPQTTVSYIHRIGRTGRAGRPGEAITFFTEDDAEFIRPIANILRDSGCEVPEYMLSIQKPTKNRRRKVEKRPIHRAAVSSRGISGDLAHERKQKKDAMKRKMKLKLRRIKEKK